MSTESPVTSFLDQGREDGTLGRQKERARKGQKKENWKVVKKEEQFKTSLGLWLEEYGQKGRNQFPNRSHRWIYTYLFWIWGATINCVLLFPNDLLPIYKTTVNFVF